MNISNNPECSSGCESGWTMYWDQLSNSNIHEYPYTKDFAQQDQEEEDLSTVSDASSAPPHFLENYTSQVSEDKKKSKKKIFMSKTKEANNKKQQHSFCLDDTASSSIFHFSQDNVAHQQYLSVEHVPGFSSQQDEPKPKKHLGFFKSSSKGKSGSFLGRKRQ